MPVAFFMVALFKLAAADWGKVPLPWSCVAKLRPLENDAAKLYLRPFNQ